MKMWVQQIYECSVHEMQMITKRHIRGMKTSTGRAIGDLSDIVQSTSPYVGFSMNMNVNRVSLMMTVELLT